MHTHDGFYLRLGFGLGAGIGKWKPDAGGDSNNVGGVSSASEFALGGTVAPGLVLGGGIYGSVLFAPTYKTTNGPDLKGSFLVLSSIGPFIDYYFDPHGGGHIQAAIALAAVQQQSGKDFPEQLSGTGFATMLGGGYEWWIGEQWSFGVLGRLQYFAAKVKPDNVDVKTDISMFVPAILAGLTYH